MLYLETDASGVSLSTGLLQVGEGMTYLRVTASENFILV